MNSAARTPGTASAETAILALIERINQAHRDKDAFAIAAAYAHDAAISDLAPPLSRRGLDIDKKRAWLQTWDGPVERVARDFTITVNGDAAWGHGFLRLSGTPKAAGKPISFWMRATVCFARDHGAWRIVHEHLSVPFYMDGSLRPAFDLTP